MKLPALSALLILTAGCGHPHKATAYIDASTLNLGEGIVLELALEDLETRAHERVFHSHDAPDLSIKLKFGELPYPILGQALPNEEECEIVISNVLLLQDGGRWEAEDLKHTLIHEIGHCFGLNHTSDPTDIMYFEYVRSQNSDSSYQRFIEQLQTARIDF